ncbi:MAG TPA: two-component sensor histidine kinase [Janthinobacterium sp.]|nr:two-component sensor histidine kinase [Janthinobacterium sp.]
MDKIKRAIRAPWLPASLGKGPYLWPIFLCFLLVKYIDVRAGTGELAWLLASVFLFLLCYFASFWGDSRRALLYLLLTCLMGALWAPHNAGASVFFIFAASMCARVQPPRVAFAMVAAVLALAGLTGATLDAGRLEFLVPALLVGLAVGLSGIVEASSRRAHLRLLRKQEEVEHLATIAERERISRDLHDLLGHTLSLITLKAELAGKLLQRDEAACRQEIKDIEHSARHALAEVRAAVSGYRQTGFAHELAGARVSLAAANVEMSSSVATLALPAAAETVLALALREAVTNIVRHAGATRCAVDLALRSGSIVCRIADDGALLTNVEAIRRGNGLTGMAERLRALGGDLALSVERGLVLELRLPMESGR